MLRIQGKKYVRNHKRTIASLQSKGIPFDGSYKLKSRKFGADITLTLFDCDSNPFAAVRNDSNSTFFVTARPDGKDTLYMNDATKHTEEALEINFLSGKEKRLLAEEYIAAAMDMRSTI